MSRGLLDNKAILALVVLIILVVVVYFVNQNKTTKDKKINHEDEINKKMNSPEMKAKMDEMKQKMDSPEMKAELKRQFEEKRRQNPNNLYSFDSSIDIVSTGGKVNVLSTNGGVHVVSTNGDAALMTTNGNVGTISLNGSYKTLSGLDTYIMTKNMDTNGTDYKPNINLVSASNKIGLGLSKRHGYSEFDYNDNNKEIEEDTRLGLYWGDEKPYKNAPNGSIYLDRTGKLWVRKDDDWAEVMTHN